MTTLVLPYYQMALYGAAGGVYIPLFYCLGANGACGILAAMFSKTATAPLERLVVYSQQTDFSNYAVHIRHILQENGLKGFWKGNIDKL